jgi:hypothetical protein
VVVDGAQGAPHLDVDVQDLGVDFYALSGHKLYGPTGIGALYGRHEIFETLPPWQGGGSMIQNVTFKKTTYKGLPDRYEAGTPHIAGAIGLGAAVDYVGALDRAGLEAHERDVLEYGTRALGEVPGLRLIGTAKNKIGVLSFVVDGTLTISGRSSTPKVSPSERGTTARSRSWRASECPPLRARRSPFSQLETTSIGSSAPSTRRRRCSADGPARALPGADPRPRTASEKFPLPRGGESMRRGKKSSLRRSRRRSGAGRERRHCRRRVSGFRVRHLDCRRVDDD